jgi:PKHD-type hydroxylase
MLTGNREFLGISQTPLLDADECDRVIELAESLDNWSTAGIYSGSGAGVELTERSVASVPVPGDESTWPLDVIIDAIAEVNDRVYRFDLDEIPGSDHPSVLRYDAGTADHFRSHRDVGSFSPTRKLTFIVQLSDPADYRGCDLVFSEYGEVARRDRGTLVVFPTFEFHHVTPVLSGRRYAVVGWVHGPTFH